MTYDEYQNLKPGDLLLRIVDDGGSPRGYQTTVLAASGWYSGLHIRHKNGVHDHIKYDWWDLVKKFDKPKSGFAKFIKRVEQDASKI